MIPKLVIFDCDGVLVDTEPTTERLMAQSLARYGLQISHTEVAKLFTGGTMKSAGETARAMGAQLPDDWVSEMNAEVAAELAKGVDTYPGLFDLLDALDDAGVATAVASNGPMSKMKVSLSPSGLWDRFEDRILSGHDYTPKPDPHMLTHAMQRHGASAQDTVFVDDSVSGCKAGLAAKVRTFGFRPNGNLTDLTALGAIPFRSMDAIKAALF